MLETGQGSIINVVSSGVLMTSTGGAYYGARPWSVEMPYQATKSALTTASFYLSEELFSEGIAVNSVMPGHTRASWFDATARAFRSVGRDLLHAAPGGAAHVADHLVPQPPRRPRSPRACTGRLYPRAGLELRPRLRRLPRPGATTTCPSRFERGYQELEAALPGTGVQAWRGPGSMPSGSTFAAGMDKVRSAADGAW